MKKIIAILLVLTTLISMFVVNTYAINESDAINVSAALANEIPETNAIGDVVPKCSAEEKRFDINSHMLQNEIYVAEDFCRKVCVLNSANTKYFGLQDKLSYNLNIDNVCEYDYVALSFSSTQGITLNNDNERSIVNYGETQSNMLLEFELNENKQKYDIVTNYRDVEFEKITIDFDVILNAQTTQRDSVLLYVLATEHGTFLSKYDGIFAYDNYITYLYNNSLITDEVYKEAQKKMTEMREVESVDAYNDLVLAKKQSSDDEASISLPSTNAIAAEPYEVNVTRYVEASSAGDVLTISGKVYFRDVEGNIHPARNIEVQIMDEDTGILDNTDDLLATIYTSNTGYYEATINNRTGIIENGYDIYIRVNTTTNEFTIKPTNNTGIYSNGYYLRTPVSQDMKATDRIRTYDIGDDVQSRAVMIHQALLVGYHYYKSMNNNYVHSIVVNFPEEGSASSSIEDYIEIEADDYCDWDVILHELGHQVSDEINVDAAFFGDHFIDENLIETYGKEIGVNGGWNEGWASYFSMASQNYYDANVTNISNIAYVADNMYTDITVSDGSYSTGIDWSYTYDDGYGEGNEVAVTAALLNFVEKGIITHQNLWDIAKANQCDNMSQFITALYANVEKPLYSEVGRILEDQNIADTPNVTTSIYSRANPGVFYWTSASTQDPYGDFDDGLCNYLRTSRIVFLDSDYNVLMQSAAYPSAYGTSGITIDSSLWYSLASEIDDNEFYWCIATSRSDTPITGPYYSSFHKAYFEEAIVTISNLNTNYYGVLDEDDEGKLFKFTAPITDYYTFYSTGSLDVNVTVYTKSVLEKTTVSDENDGEGNNFLYRKHLDAGEIVYLRVREKNGEGGGFNIAVARTTSCIINASETISINGTDGIWYRLHANSSGTLTFFTTGNIDVYGELFKYPAVNGSTANRLAYDDDSGDYTNFMFSYDIEALETVYIRIRGYFSSTNGTCNFAVVWTPDVPTLDKCYEDEIIAGGYTIYKFTAPTAGIYTFYTSGDMDTYMDMFNEPVLDGTTVDGWVDYDDDSGTGCNAAITRQLSEDQTVFIRVRGYDSEEDITYGFTVVESKELSIANSSTGYLEEGGMLWYVFSASEDGIYAIYTTGNIDTYGDIFEFFVPDGETTDLIISNDDDEITNEATTNFRIVITLSKGDTIYIRVRGYRTSVTGSFNICVVKQEEEQ